MASTTGSVIHAHTPVTHQAARQVHVRAQAKVRTVRRAASYKKGAGSTNLVITGNLSTPQEPAAVLRRQALQGVLLGLASWATVRGSHDSALALGSESVILSDQADARVEELEQQMRKLRQAEFKLEKLITDARGDRSVAIAQQAGAQPYVSEVLELYPETWDKNIGQTRPIFVEFYAPWCPYCKRLEPIWKELSEDPVAKENNVQIARLNADTYTDFMARYDVSGYPTLILFQDGKPSKLYKGRVDFDSLKAFIV